MIEDAHEDIPPYERRWDDHGHRELSGDQARQAKPLGHMRYVLGVSLTLIVAAFAIVYFAFGFHG
jgi:hypothetical protein